MCPFKFGKEKLTLEEIKDILRRNIELYHDKPEFVDYFIDLTLYLLRYKFEEEERQYQALSEGEEKFYTSASPQFPSESEHHYCRFCGASIGSERRCPICGNLNY
jgi:rubrerythrin